MARYFGVWVMVALVAALMFALIRYGKANGRTLMGVFTTQEAAQWQAKRTRLEDFRVLGPFEGLAFPAAHVDWRRVRELKLGAPDDGQ